MTQAFAPGMTLGALLSRTCAIWWRHLPTFTFVALVFHVPAWIGTAKAWSVSVLEVDLPGMTLDVWWVANVALRLLAVLLTTGALAPLVLDALDGRPRGRVIVRAVRGSLRSVPVALAVFAAVVIASVALVVPGMVARAALWVAVPVVVLEGGGVRAVLSRSGSLTRGHRWPLLVTMVVLHVLENLAFNGTKALLSSWNALPPDAVRLASYVAVSVVVPATAIGSVVAYHDLRAEKEGVGNADFVKVFE